MPETSVTLRPWSIYSLSDPRTGEVRYVGFATRLQRRFIEHISAARERTYKANWVKSLLKIGLRPVLAVLEEGVGPTWQEREKFWIAHYRATGAPLTNMTDGGDGVLGSVRSADTCAKLSSALMGKKRPREVVERWLATKRQNGPSERQIQALKKISEKNKGRKMPPEDVARRAALLVGRKLAWSPEAIARQKGKNKGTKKSAETRARMSAASLRRGPVSPETRAKLSKVRTGKPLSAEHKAKLSAKLSGRHLTDEHRAKISAGLAANHAARKNA